MRGVLEASAQDPEALGEQQTSDLAQYFGASRALAVCSGGDVFHRDIVGGLPTGSQRYLFGSDGDCAGHPFENEAMRQLSTELASARALVLL